MPVTPQIIAAISGAISAYIAEEEAACRAAAPGAPGLPIPPPNLWGLAGRSEAMQMRSLLQRRSLR
jgi:hypothetical protein